MSIQYTPEELAAIKINKRNYSTVLGIIYFLKKLKTSPFANPYVAVVNSSNSLVGESGSTGTFSLDAASYAKGDNIVISGTATFQSIGATTEMKKALSLAAHIDTPAANGNVPQVVYADGDQVQLNGDFSFSIPSSITSKLAAGTHTVYIDALSPKGIKKLTGGTDGVRTFTIT